MEAAKIKKLKSKNYSVGSHIGVFDPSAVPASFSLHDFNDEFEQAASSSPVENNEIETLQNEEKQDVEAIAEM